jgi:hypothetical protein
MYTSLRLHHLSHKGTTLPPIEECQKDALPEGYVLKVPAKKPTQAPRKSSASSPGTDEHEGDEHHGKPAGGGKGPLYKEEEEPTEILKRALESFPGIPESAKKEVLSWPELTGHPLSPYEVQHLLEQLADVPKGAINIVPQKYQLALDKAGREGSAKVRMVLDLWAGSRRDSRDEELPPAMGGLYGQPGAERREPPWGYGRREREDDYPPRRRYREDIEPPAEDPRLAGLEKTVNTLATSVEALTTKKKEDEINARFDRIEQNINNLAAGLHDRPTGSETDPFEKIQAQLTALKDEMSAKDRAAMEERLAALQKQIDEGKASQLDALKAEVTELRNKVSNPPVGMNSMDVLNHIVDKGITAVEKAGTDLKAIIMVPATREQFSTERLTPQDRAAAGNKIAVAIDKEATLISKEDDFLRIAEERKVPSAAQAA